MTETNYDVALIGSGHATWHTAVTLKQAGKSVVLIERDMVAGTCINYGCDAKSLLDGPSELLTQLKNYHDQGVTTATIVDWKSFMAYKHRVIDSLPNQMTALFNQMGIDIIHGSAVLMGNHCIQVNGEIIRATNIVIGTGQHSKRLQISGREFMHDSREFLELPELPDHVTLIGAGIISLEFAALIMQLGAQVTIIDRGSRAVKGFSSEQATKLIAKMEAAGATFYFNETVLAVDVTTDGYIITTANGVNIATNYVLDATSREPNVTHLGLENAGIHSNANGIEVDDHLRANGDNIYASGDVIDKQLPQLTPTAMFEANYIARQILGDTAPIVYPVIPSVLFSLPRLAQVGVTVDEATANAEKDFV